MGSTQSLYVLLTRGHEGLTRAGYRFSAAVSVEQQKDMLGKLGPSVAES